MDGDEFISYIKQADYHALHNLRDNKLKIKDYPYTNLSRSKNILEFEQIEELFSIKHLESK